MKKINHIDSIRHPIITEKDDTLRNFRIQMSKLVAEIIERGMKILGIEMPERM